MPRGCKRREVQHGSGGLLSEDGSKGVCAGVVTESIQDSYDREQQS
jgi:hypothetical protein